MPTLEATLELETLIRPPLAETPDLLFISPSAEDRIALRPILQDLNWRLLPAARCRDAFELLSAAPTVAILCEERLEDGTWKDVLRRTPASPLIVTSRLADAYLWSEVLNLGGYDVVSKPFSQRELAHVLRSVVLHAGHEKHIRAAAGM
jgi:DNA-binding NtrC family response regulator